MPPNTATIHRQVDRKTRRPIGPASYMVECAACGLVLTNLRSKRQAEAQRSAHRCPT